MLAGIGDPTRALGEGGVAGHVVGAEGMGLGLHLAVDRLRQEQHRVSVAPRLFLFFFSLDLGYDRNFAPNPSTSNQD